MKTGIINRLSQKYSFLALCILFIIACSKDDDEPSVIFKYATETFEVNFQSEGSIPAPTINWPGKNGTFALKNAMDGLQIDSNSGLISIEKSLPIGEHEVVVYAINDKGTWITGFTLNYRLKNALLTGGQNNNPNSVSAIAINRNLSLHEDGTLDIEIQDQEDSLGVGVWTLENDTFKMHLCTYCADMDPQAVPDYDEHLYYEGSLTYQEDDGASIHGQWFIIRFDPDLTTLRGDFVFLWEWDQ